MDLTSLQHSFFLSALGNAILHSLWQGFLLWVIYETIIISYKSVHAKMKHNLSALMVFASFGWFMITLIQNFLVGEALPALFSDTSVSLNPGNPKSSFFDFFNSITGAILPYLSVAYILLLVFLMAKLFASYRRVHFISTKNLISPEDYLESFSSKAAWQLGISTKIKIWISHHIDVPATIGFIKPVILIPFASVNQLTTHQLEAIILHELGHIKRNDYLVNLLVSVIETLLFFNPFVATFIKTIKRERENCCDDLVLEYRYDPHAYASALLRLEQSRKENVQLALSAVSGKKQLLSRIKRITGNGTTVQFNYGQKLLALLITTGIFCSLAWMSPTKIRKERKEALAASISSTSEKISEVTKKDKGSMNQASATTAKTDLLEMNALEGPTTEADLNDDNQSNDQDEINADNTTNADISLNWKKQFTNETESKIANVVRKAVPKFTINGVPDLDEQISKGLHEAFLEIGKVDWGEIKSDINNSISDIKINELPQNQKKALATAKKYLSLIQMGGEKLNTSKLLQQIQKQQKLIADSLNAAGTILINQRPAKMAATLDKDEIINLKVPGTNFSFNFKNGSAKKRILNITNGNQSNNGTFNATELRTLINDASAPTKISDHGKQQPAKTMHRVIIDI